MENVMTRAWEIATEGQKKFGGKRIEYIAESLKQAWAEFKLEGEARQPEYTDEFNRKVILGMKGDLLETFGSNSQPHWLAEIKGLHPKYKFDREFVDCYSGAKNSDAEYKIEENKVYEFCPSRKYNNRHYFIKVDGIIIELKPGQVKELYEEEENAE
ncbi:hypothetical protein QP246_02585 [Aerococcus urinae]|uniref:hypothetical protein n=1 Tax=Aerococcus urinae TaxID=1376 RepID=UPI00254F6A0F|nr:hypothetical protein [Aerococcus urinae]MDK6688345.1 hypothetical protein [Aerococcus urinae]